MTTLTILIGDYPHTRPLRDGRVTSELIEFAFIDEYDPVSSGFDRMVREQAFDVSEMAIGAFLQGHAAAAPIALLPVVVVGGFHHSTIRYWPANGIVTPSDLQGQTLAVRAYSQTTGLWARAILAEQYAIDLESLRWLVTLGSHSDAYLDPPNVTRVPEGETLPPCSTSWSTRTSAAVRDGIEVIRRGLYARSWAAWPESDHGSGRARASNDPFRRRQRWRQPSFASTTSGRRYQAPTTASFAPPLACSADGTCQADQHRWNVARRPTRSEVRLDRSVADTRDPERHLSAHRCGEPAVHPESRSPPRAASILTVATPRLRSANLDWARALERTSTIHLSSARTLAAVVDARADIAPTHAALIGETRSLSYADLAGTSRRVARWALALGLKPGDCVALMMENDPAYVAIWLGLSRIGVVTALLNTSLAGGSLGHCIAAASPRHLIASTTSLGASGIIELTDLRVWRCGVGPDDRGDFDDAIAACAADPLSAGDAPFITLRDPALLIYTSGTTGLPKAARVSHFRIMMWSEWFAGIMDARQDDRLYDCLPMYHAVGGVVAVGAMLAAGGTVIVRRGFSASRFWPDVAQSGATIFQYIGELCRYLVATPEQETDRAHSLRLCCGNGLRAEVWTALAGRFAIPRIIEFYAATEGSFSLFNLEGKPGAIGRIPPFMAHRSPVALVRHDVVTERPFRDADGFCIPCAPGEAGEAIGRLSRDAKDDAKDLATRFEGYTSAEESERKVLRDVFAPGDRWFRTGDLMTRDRQGFFVFADRIGDTFRWKGENVSTAEVADALAVYAGVVDVTVYGVPVASADGRAGMAALVIDDAFDLAALPRHLETRLPSYARPVFLRILPSLDRTETFRPKKHALVAEGCDPQVIADRMFVQEGDAYRPLDAARFALIAEGAIRL